MPNPNANPNQVSPSASHPLTRDDALARVNDADVLGKGQFGKVYRGSSKKHGDVAIKVVPFNAPSHERSRIALEAKILYLPHISPRSPLDLPQISARPPLDLP